MKRWSLSLPAAVLLCVPRAVHAQGRTLSVGFGSNITLEQLVTNVVNYLAKLIVYVSATLFLIGAFMLIISRGEGTNLERGKSMIFGALLGMCVTLAAAAIIRTVYYFLYNA